MLNLKGRVINIFKQQGGTNRKGETFEDRDKVQLLGALDLPNGEVKNELVTLSVDDPDLYQEFINKDISVPVGVMAMGRNVIFYVAKGSIPTLSS